MSSGFMPGGDDAWNKVQQDLEAKRKQKREEGIQEGGKTLYEVLQANKAAKQEAFEESIRLKHQFRTLDEDEVEFLDSVLESTRAKEEAVKKETTEQLEAFRKQQEAAENSALADVDDYKYEQPVRTTLHDQWTAKKRRRDAERLQAGGLKLRKTSSSNDADKLDMKESQSADKTDARVKESSPTSRTGEDAPGKEKTETITSKPSATALGLGDYDSDDD